MYKQIPSWPLYEISEMASVRRIGSRKTLKASTCKRGDNAYRVVNLSDGHGRRYTRYVHSLLLEAHVGPRPPGMVARHLDDEGLHNWLENLQWGTPLENHQDQVRNGKTTPKRDYCAKGLHKMQGANIIRGTKPTGKPRRQCRPCFNAWRRDSDTRRRAEEFTRSLGVPRGQEHACMVQLWGRSFIEERDRRAGERGNVQRKGWIARELYAELSAGLAA